MLELSETEQKILVAATTVFLERGREGARMQEIADLAGINKALLHYYFRSKDKLYELVAEREIRQFFGELLTVVTTEAAFDQWLRNFIHHYLQTISRHPYLVRFMLWEIETGGGKLSGVIREMLASTGFFDNPLVGIIRKAMSQSLIRKVDPAQFIISLLACCVFPFIGKPILERMIDNLEVQSSEFLAAREAAIFDLFWNGLKPDKS